MVGTEVEALQLEYSWIKEFDPRFNVKYRDDKSYPYLAVTMNEEFPRVMVMRGPSARAPGTSALLPRLGDPRHRRHPAESVPGADLLGGRVQAGWADRPAVPAWLHRQVLGPLRGRVTAEEHRELAEDFCDFVAGQTTRFTRG